MERFDVLIIGAGLSGIGAGARLRMDCPNKSFAILEGREAMGGTWDLFRYPGIRSDSDMYTLGYRFRPWSDPKAIADGPAILEYVRKTSKEFDLDKDIRYNHRIGHASWSSEDSLWSVEAETRPLGTVSDGDTKYRLNYDFPHSIGRVKAFYGNFGMMTRALSYIYTHGATGLKEATEAAVLNARYTSNALADAYDKPFESDCMHEAIFSHKKQSKKGVVTLDIAKRLIDYGFHPMTVYFPLVVEGAMLIEPTESVGRADLDAFIEAMIDIDREAQDNPQLVIDAPHSTRIGRLDEATAARKPVLRWKPDMETLTKTAN